MLSIVPTPIGNTEDITLRGLRLFQEAQVIICENTGTTKKLMNIYQISTENKRFIKFTSHDHKSIDYIISQIQNQETILVSEAGTPGLSDPGKMLIIAAQEANIPTTFLPGANALIPSVIMAAFPTTHRTFAGFLPHKKGRETAIKTMIESDHATFFYESVHRISKLIEQLEKANFMGILSIAREISKHFEQYITGDLTTIKSMIQNNTIPLKGEFVIGLYPKHSNEQTKVYDVDSLE